MPGNDGNASMHEFKQSHHDHSLAILMYLGGILVAVGILGLAALIVSLVLSQQHVLTAGSTDDSFTARLDELTSTMVSTQTTVEEIEKLV